MPIRNESLLLPREEGARRPARKHSEYFCFQYREHFADLSEQLIAIDSLKNVHARLIQRLPQSSGAVT